MHSAFQREFTISKREAGGAAHKTLKVSTLTFELLDLHQRTVDALLQFVHVVQHALVQVSALSGIVLDAV